LEKRQFFIIMGVSGALLLVLFLYRHFTTPAPGKTTPRSTPTTARKDPGKSPAETSARPTSPDPSTAQPATPAGKASARATLAPAADRAATWRKDLTQLATVEVLLRYARVALDRKEHSLAVDALRRGVAAARSDAERLAVAELACGEETASLATPAGLVAVRESLVKAAGTPEGGGPVARALVAALCRAGGGKLPDDLLKLARSQAKTDPELALVAAHQCGAELARKQPAAAAPLCKEAVEKGGGELAKLNAARLELLGNPRSERAELLLQQVLTLRPAAVAAAELLSELYTTRGGAREAAAVLQKLGSALHAEGLSERALAVLDRAVKAQPTVAEAHLCRADALDALGRVDDAIQGLQAATVAVKGSVAVRLKLADLLQEKDLLGAIRVLEEAAQIDPNDPATQRALDTARVTLAGRRPELGPEQVTRITGKRLALAFTSRGGMARSLVLQHPRYRERPKGKKRGQQVNLVRTWTSQWLPLRLDFSGSSFAFPSRFKMQDWDRLRWNAKKNAFEVMPEKDEDHARQVGDEIVLGYQWPVTYEGMKPPEVVVQRIYRLRPDTSYHFGMTVRVVNQLAKKQTVRLAVTIPTTDNVKEERSFFDPISLKKEAICMVGDKVRMRTLESFFPTGSSCAACDASTCACRRTPDKAAHFTGKLRWVGIDEMYFLLAVVLAEKRESTCNMQGWKEGVLEANVAFAEETVQNAGSAIEWDMKVFVGPKLTEELDQVRMGSSDAKVSEAIDYGYFWFLGQPMMWLMKKLQKVVVNWGVAIILLTLLIKLLTLPFTIKQMQSMKGMARLKPELDALKEKCGDDKQRFQQETFALYKAHKINPFGGCLPMLLQMPIYIAWYQALMVSVDLYQAPLFGWITDLTKPDTISIAGHGVPILPLLMGAAMFLQQKMTPTSADNQQAKMMLYMMPAMFTFFMLFLPSGLTLYILTNTVLSMTHQWYMNHSD
jgi:YidC/Oxa1 family membrane protein insertase